MTEGNKNCAKYTKHTAKWNKKYYNLSTTDWSRMIGCPISQVERGLKKYGSIQQYIDVCHEKTQKIAELSNFFLYRRTC